MSRLCEEIDERVKAFLGRPLEGDWPYLWLDATYIKARRGGRIVSVAAIVAVAVSTKGRREVLGLAIGPSEAETFWTDFLRSLSRRGLRGVKLVISDAHDGLKAAAAKVLGATWQRCRVHFMRNALAHVTKGQRLMVAAAMRTAFVQENHQGAVAQWRQVADSLRKRFAKLAKLMDEAEHDVLAFMTQGQLEQDPLHQPPGAPQQGDQTPHQHRRAARAYAAFGDGPARSQTRPPSHASSAPFSPNRTTSGRSHDVT